MIYTCTLNPSIDYKLEAEEFLLGTLNRPVQSFFYPGGKGINVSRVLKNLNTPSIALGFIGGFTGNFIINWLEQEGVKHDFVIHDSPTRINIKLKSNKEETEINGNGAIITEDMQQFLLEKISKLTSRDYLVLAGSLPSSISFQYYEKISELCHQLGVSLIVDTSGQDLLNLLKYEPFLIKPNHDELSEILGEEMNSIDAVMEGGRKLNKLGAKNVIISMGGQGAVLINENSTLYAKAPKGELKSTIGSGDSMVAGFLASFIQTENLHVAFQYSVASGSATAFSYDLCKKDEVEKLLPKIHIESLKR